MGLCAGVYRRHAVFTALLLSESTRHYGTHRTLVAILPLFFFCGLLIEYQTVTVRITWLCASVGILMVYILYSELRQKTDALTHLLNRSSYESRLAALREHAVIYYFDVDEFKSINDTYGHGEGDSMLSEVSGVIYASFPTWDTATASAATNSASLRAFPTWPRKPSSPIFCAG